MGRDCTTPMHALNDNRSPIWRGGRGEKQGFTWFRHIHFVRVAKVMSLRLRFQCTSVCQYHF